MPGIVAGSPVCSYWSWPPSCWVFLLVPQNWKTANRKYWETNMWLSKDQSKRQIWSPITKTPVPTIWSTASSTFPAWNRILVNFYSQEMTFSSTWLSAVLFFVVFIDKPVSGISQNEKKCNVCVKSYHYFEAQVSNVKIKQTYCTGYEAESSLWDSWE